MKQAWMGSVAVATAMRRSRLTTRKSPRSKGWTRAVRRIKRASLKTPSQNALGEWIRHSGRRNVSLSMFRLRIRGSPVAPALRNRLAAD